VTDYVYSNEALVYIIKKYKNRKSFSNKIVKGNNRKIKNRKEQNRKNKK